jgi:putative endopeptidase
MIIDQFSAFKFPEEKVNGVLTQGENIADLGGISVSFAAFQKWLDSHPDYVPEASDFNEEQRFFLAYAQRWGTLIRDEAARNLLATDPHSPPKWRVDGILYFYLTKGAISQSFTLSSASKKATLRTCRRIRG